MKIIYICNSDVSVFESQVVELLNYYQTIGLEVTLLQGYSTPREKESIVNKLSRHKPIHTVWFSNYPTYPIYENKLVDSIYSALKNIDGYMASVIHMRSEYIGYIMSKLQKKYALQIPMLVDIRGVVYEELKYKITQMKGKRKFLSIIQKWYFGNTYKEFFKECNAPMAITSVSPLINQYIAENYPKFNCDTYFNPNIAGKQFLYSEQQRESVRKKYDIALDERLAVCSTAGNAVWQKDYQVVEQLVKCGIKVINLSKNKLDLPGVITTTVPFNDMPAILSAADIAVLWRDDTFMNQSASPSKFSEFASMGLYVIHNKSVAVATDYIQKTGAGLLVSEVSEINELPDMHYLQDNRQQWISRSKETFGVEKIAESYISIYKRILTK